MEGTVAHPKESAFNSQHDRKPESFWAGMELNPTGFDELALSAHETGSRGVKGEAERQEMCAQQKRQSFGRGGRRAQGLSGAAEVPPSETARVPSPSTLTWNAHYPPADQFLTGQGGLVPVPAGMLPARETCLSEGSAPLRSLCSMASHLPPRSWHINALSTACE